MHNARLFLYLFAGGEMRRFAALAGKLKHAPPKDAKSSFFELFNHTGATSLITRRCATPGCSFFSKDVSGLRFDRAKLAARGTASRRWRAS